MNGKRSRNSRFGEDEIPSPDRTTSISSVEDFDLSFLNYLVVTGEEMAKAVDAANSNASAVQNARSKHKGDLAWEKSTYPYSEEGTSNGVSNEPAAMGYWNGHMGGNPNHYVPGGRPYVGHSCAPDIESMHGQRSAGPQNNNQCFDNRHESRDQMCGYNAKKQATQGEAASSSYPPKLELFPPENHQNHGYGDNLNNRNLMDATLPTQHALISSNSITSLQPFQSSAVANNTEQKSSKLSVIESRVKSVISSRLTSYDMNPTLDFVEAGNGDWHSALDVEPLQMCMQSDCNDGQIMLNNKIMLPSEEDDKRKDSKQAKHGKKGTNGPVNEIRKYCSCKKSRCLKLYCECFAAEQFCNEACKCNCCSNKASDEDMILANKRRIKNRNPHAFSPKFVHGNGEPAEIWWPKNKLLCHRQGNEQASTSSAWHKRGCNCMKSKCQKRYCECYQVSASILLFAFIAGVGCSSECRCENCENDYGRKVYHYIIDTVLEQEPRKEDVLYSLTPGQVQVNGSQNNINANSAQPFNHEINTHNPFQGSYGMNVIGAPLPVWDNPRLDSDAAAVSHNQQLPCSTSVLKILAMQSLCHANFESDLSKFLNKLTDYCSPSSTLTRRANRTSDELLNHLNSLPVTTIFSLIDEMFMAERRKWRKFKGTAVEKICAIIIIYSTRITNGFFLAIE
ncbi:hypothetical protein HPP92_008451 [Vanilla planifolia]|uniref:CRC domain-containing protein n=1 Tax=Vanilla planifolia TaxID=51239 RepID=A0A835V7X3_VANPL|nr:hypothetical protein HPP92_008451 [Vanilla planifolia]